MADQLTRTLEDLFDWHDLQGEHSPLLEAATITNKPDSVVIFPEPLSDQTVALIADDPEIESPPSLNLIRETLSEPTGSPPLVGTGTTATLEQFTLFANNVVSPAPDLLPIAFNVAIDHVAAGTATLTLTIANQGTVEAHSFVAALIYSPNETLGDADDVTLGTTAITGIPATATVTQTLEVSLPKAALNEEAQAEDPPGQGAGYRSNNVSYLGVVVDPDNEIAEQNESNNWSSVLGVGQDDITYFPWDVNGDGQVTPSDAIYVVNRLGQAAIASETAIADFDGNGLINPADAIAVINRLGYAINPSVNDDNGSALALDFDRIAVSADGNADPDDIGATPATLAMLVEAGLQDLLVHYHVNSQVWQKPNNPKNPKMRESAFGSADLMGFDRGLFFDAIQEYQADGPDNAATQHLANAINVSSATDKLLIIGAGPMEMIYQAVKLANPAKRSFISVLSHSHVNDQNTGDGTGHTRVDIENLGVTFIDIRDQNPGLSTQKDFGPWTWMQNEDAKWQWVYERMQAGGKADISDAGMLYYAITGEERGTIEDLRAFIDATPDQLINSAQPLVSMQVAGDPLTDYRSLETQAIATSLENVTADTLPTVEDAGMSLREGITEGPLLNSDSLFLQGSPHFDGFFLTDTVISANI